MRIKIYQINPEKDKNNVQFICLGNLAKHQGSSVVDSSIYELVFQGEINCSDLEDLYSQISKGNYPIKLSVSDVVVDESAAYFCNNFGFKKIDFDESLTSSSSTPTTTSNTNQTEPEVHFVNGIKSCNDYLDVLKLYRDLHLNESGNTEKGAVANAIDELFGEMVELEAEGRVHRKRDTQINNDNSTNGPWDKASSSLPNKCTSTDVPLSTTVKHQVFAKALIPGPCFRGEVWYSCPHCGDSIEAHSIRHFEQTKPDTYLCPKCHQEFYHKEG